MITVAWKWSGVTSNADRTALEVALRLADTAVPVTVLTVGPPAAEPALREALAVGATHAVRIEATGDVSSAVAAAALATRCGASSWVLCGDASADRGSGSVPAFLAAELGIGQALGLVAVERLAAEDPTTAPLRVTRRLDGGRREVLVARPPTVLSVEGALLVDGIAATLRRAPLGAELAAQSATIDTVADCAGSTLDVPAAIRPYQPPPRRVPPPDGDAIDRIAALTAAAARPATATEALVLDPPAAAAAVLDALARWGYLATPP